MKTNRVCYRGAFGHEVHAFEPKHGLPDPAVPILKRGKAIGRGPRRTLGDKPAQQGEGRSYDPLPVVSAMREGLQRERSAFGRFHACVHPYSKEPPPQISDRPEVVSRDQHHDACRQRQHAGTAKQSVAIHVCRQHCLQRRRAELAADVVEQKARLSRSQRRKQALSNLILVTAFRDYLPRHPGEGLHARAQQRLARPRRRRIKNSAGGHVQALANDCRQHCREHHTARHVIHNRKICERPPDGFRRVLQLRLCRHARRTRPLPRQKVQTSCRIVTRTVQDSAVASHCRSRDDSSQGLQHRIHALCCCATPEPLRRVAAFVNFLVADLARPNEIHVAIEIVEQPVIRDWLDAHACNSHQFPTTLEQIASVRNDLQDLVNGTRPLSAYQANVGAVRRGGFGGFGGFSRRGALFPRASRWATRRPPSPAVR